MSKRRFAVSGRQVVFISCLIALAGCGKSSSSSDPVTTAPAETQLALTGLTQKGLATYTTSVNATAIDSSGNIYLAGTSSGNLVSGSGAATGGYDILVAKYDRKGTLKWIQQVGVSPRQSSAYAVAVDSSGNVYAGGSTTGQLETGTSSSIGGQDLVLIKFDSAGVKQWVRQVGATGNAYSSIAAISLDPTGKVNIAGGTDGNLSAGAGAATGTNDAFVAQYDSSGTRQWITQLGEGTYYTFGNGLATDASGNLYLTGNTPGNLVAGAGAATGTKDYYIAKFNSSGTKLWVVQAGVAGKTTESNAAAVDSSGNVYIAGDTNTNLQAGSGNATGGYDYFVAKYNSAGTRLWVKQRGGTGNNTFGLGLAVDASGNAFVSGNTGVNLSAGSGSSVGGADGFVAKYDTSGTFSWVKQNGATSAVTRAYAVAIDSAGSALVCGQTAGNLVAGAGSATGAQDYFFTAYSSAGVQQK
jgi:hypothetical protein